MNWRQILLSTIVAVAMAITPFLSAGAMSSEAGIASQVASHAANPASAEAPEHCASSATDASEADLSSCDNDKACSVELCLAKCFYFLSVLPASAADVSPRPTRFLRAGSGDWFDWSSELPPLPPRS